MLHQLARCFDILRTIEHQHSISTSRSAVDALARALGAIAIAGAGVTWLRDGLGILESAEQSEEVAASVDDTAGVFFVPAFRCDSLSRVHALHCCLSSLPA